MLGASQHELPRHAAPVDGTLQVGKQLGTALRLVYERAAGILAEETTRILLRKPEQVGILQAGIRLGREHLPCQRGLARLARPDDRHDLELARQGPGQWFCLSGNHEPTIRPRRKSCKSGIGIRIILVSG